MTIRLLLTFLVNISILSTISIHHALASENTQTMEVMTLVDDVCTINVNNLNFGRFNSKSDDTASTTISIKCTYGTPYTIGIDRGSGPSATLDNRKMSNGKNVLQYSLYQDSGRKKIWGDGVANSLVADGNGYEQLYTIYGKIFSNQSAASGDYMDYINISLYWGYANSAVGWGEVPFSYQASTQIRILAHKD